MKKSLSLILALVMLIGLLPQITLPARAAEPAENKWAGKKVSILSHSMSTYAGVSNSTASNSTLGNNDVYYTAGRHDVYREDTWWQQVIDALGMELLVNNSWSGSCVFMPRKGEASVGYGDRAINLHNDYTGEEPDIIFVYLGCNDFAYYKDTFGKAADVDYAALIQDNGNGTYTYAVPTTTCEAYAIMLHKVETRYPDAEIYCMTSTARRETDYTGDSYPDAGQPTAYSAELQTIAKRFGYPVIDLENAIPKEVELFDKYMGDKRAHANALGMDQITNEVLSVMLGNDAEICHVASENGTVAEQAVLLGGSYSADVTLHPGYSIKVTMDGKDITSEAYQNGKITITKVTGDIGVHAYIEHTPKDYLWNLENGELVSTGGHENNATKLSGTVTDGLLSNSCYAFTTAIVLQHDLPWVLEWKIAGNWGGMLLSSTYTEKTADIQYITRTKGGQVCFGTWLDEKHRNYGVDLSALDDNAHVYRLENHIAADGSNMIWMYVDGTEIGPMNNYYIGSAYQSTDSAWVSGRDFVFSNVGTGGYPLNNCTLDYLRVIECDHTYENGVCTACDAEHSNMANLEGKVISILGDSISTFDGYIPKADGFNLEHLARYPQDNLLTDVNETWWMQIINQLDAKLGINDSWRGATVSGAHAVTTGSTGENAAMHNLTRIQNLGSNGTPDVILFYGGTNDLAHVSKVGTFDAANVPSTVDLTTTKWDNLADGYVHTLLRLQYFYPDAQIIAMLPTYTNGYYSDDKLAEGNAVLATICEYYGVTYVDLRECGISTADLPDNIHPDATGMDYITAAVIDALLNECCMKAGENVVHTVTHKLTNAESSMGYYKGVTHGKSFTATITGEGLTVSVTMGGVDITSECYKNGAVTIPEVTGDIVITAEGDAKPVYEDHLQQLPEGTCSGTNLWAELEHDKQYYTANGWGIHSSGTVYSVSFPVSAGDRIYATSFGAAGSNGGSINGIRVTWFDENGVLKSVSADKIYEEFSTNGYIDVPESAVVVSIPMWKVSDDNEIYILNRDHCYENGVCQGCGATNGPVITKQPECVEQEIGKKFAITVKVEGEGLTYQWYYKDAGMKNFGVSSNKTSAYAYTMQRYMHNRQVYCVITDVNGNQVTTDVATITRPPMELTILEQPEDVKTAIGQKFSVSPKVQGDGLTYQWYYKDAGMKNFAVSSNKTSAYAYTMQRYMNGRQVYCVISDKYGNSVTTDVATISLPPVELKILTQPTDVYAAKGEKFSIGFEVQGDGLTYQWYYKESYMKDFKVSSNKTSAYAYAMQNYMDGRQVYCVITDQYGNQVTTDVVTLMVTQ